ncbi:glycosyl hydrolase family 18 protein [Kitasatospora sp. GAS204B]|uniref:glycosyl hydrolase family 18 protein n=1 Tax=unclassified Kitasatospora TaxID=2633591 RepID=UPI00247448F3|nr:glycosyl hydrolase family 18 protein [Kitasatospora sp. GAS204B]MDH6115727.1 chitinase [Kitasatospora sp. GAS204B]
MLTRTLARGAESSPAGRRRPRGLAALALGAGASLLLGATLSLSAGATAQAAATNTTGAAATSGGLKVAYFDQWSVYANGYYPKTIQDTGVAGKLDYLIYDFENIDPTSGKCFEATKAASQDDNNPNAGDGAGDAFADYEKSYDAGTSVSGTADTWNQPIAGNFNQLKELKAKNPNLKILLSIGGWTYSKYFSDVAASDASRKAFASSCIDMFIKGNLPTDAGFGGPGSAAGIFDGFDIDWEYPGGGGHTGNHAAPADKQNYTALLAELRSELDAQGKADGRTYALSAAVGAGQDKIQNYETDRIGQSLTFLDLMSYDMHGAWDAQGPTNHQAALYSDPNDPMTPVAPGTAKYSIDEAVKAWTAGDPQYGIKGGFPAGKINMGVPFYYRGWTGVPAGGGNGLFQTATGPATGAAMSGNVNGIRMYKELNGVVDNPADTFWDPVAQAAYFYDGSNFWSGEDARSIQAKADYLHCNGLGGSFAFSLYDLGTQTGLFDKMVDATNGSAANCPAPPTSASPTTAGPSASSSASPTSSATGSPTTLPTSTASVTPTGACTAPGWSASAVYATAGTKVSWKGHAYTNKWWTTGDDPTLSGAWGAWTDNGPC